MYVKRLALWIVCAAWFTLAEGQTMQHRYPVRALYAYAQEIKEGANDMRKQRQRRLQYYIFTELWPREKIAISHVWLRGVPVKFEVSSATSPFTLQPSIALMPGKTQADTLVKSNGGELLEIRLQEPLKNPSLHLPPRLQGYALLMAYRSGGKLYYLGAKEFQKLEAAVNQ